MWLLIHFQIPLWVASGHAHNLSNLSILLTAIPTLTSPGDRGRTGGALGLFKELFASLLSCQLYSGLLSLKAFLPVVRGLEDLRAVGIWPFSYFLWKPNKRVNVRRTKISITGMSGLGFAIIYRRFWGLKGPFTLPHSLSQGGLSLGSHSLNLMSGTAGFTGIGHT